MMYTSKNKQTDMIYRIGFMHFGGDKVNVDEEGEMLKSTFSTGNS